MSPPNERPVRPFAADRHIDIQHDLHRFFDWLVFGKRVIDVGAGLGRSKHRIRHSRVTTYDPSPYVVEHVDCAFLTPLALAGATPFDVATAFEVIEHVEDDRDFCATLDALASQAVFLTTPNWHVARCQSADHYREYTHAEWEELVCGAWPRARWWWGAYYKDAEGGWCELLSARAFREHDGLKHLALVDKGLTVAERNWLAKVEERGRHEAWSRGARP